MFVELFGRALEAVVCFGHSRVPPSEVAEQRPGSAVLFAGRVFTVKMQAGLEVLIHAAHQSIKHVARAVAFRMIEGQSPELSLPTQVEHFFPDDSSGVSTSHPLILSRVIFGA